MNPRHTENFCAQCGEPNQTGGKCAREAETGAIRPVELIWTVIAVGLCGVFTGIITAMPGAIAIWYAGAAFNHNRQGHVESAEGDTRESEIWLALTGACALTSLIA